MKKIKMIINKRKNLKVKKMRNNYFFKKYNFQMKIFKMIFNKLETILVNKVYKMNN